jgi:photosynthetic reaction center cytochrome c subunit
MNLMKPAALAATAALPLLLAGCELGPKESTQLGPRGAGMEQVNNLNLVTSPGVPPPSAYQLTSREGQKARDVYPDLKVLGDISVDEFGLLMANITAWVVPADAPPEQSGCNYCHNPENMASYEKYTKTVALSMLRMTRNINVNWQQHVKGTGVTCYTCHRGKALPAYTWSFTPDARTDTILGNTHGQNSPAKSVGYSSLPNDPNGWYFVGNREIRVAGNEIHPGGQPANIKDAEATYGLMMRVSGALGVNCTFCHNTHSFRDWESSRIQRVSAWHGIRMVRQANEEYIQPLQTAFPANMGRLGPMGDPLKVNCQTCHQGHSKPLGGVSMLADNPALAEIPAPAPVVAPQGTVIAGAVVRTTDGVAGVVATVPAATAAAVADKVQAVRDAAVAAPTG